MSNIQVKVGQENNIKIRVGQQNSTKVLSGASAFSQTTLADNVIGGIASVSSLYVSGISTFVGLGTFSNNLYVGGTSTFVGFGTFLNNLSIGGILSVVGSSNFLGTVSFSNNIQLSSNSNLYYGTYNIGGVAYFNSSGALVSSAGTSSPVTETNYVLTTNQSGIPIWSSVIDGGTY